MLMSSKNDIDLGLHPERKYHVPISDILVVHKNNILNGNNNFWLRLYIIKWSMNNVCAVFIQSSQNPDTAFKVSSKFNYFFLYRHTQTYVSSLHYRAHLRIMPTKYQTQSLDQWSQNRSPSKEGSFLGVLLILNTTKLVRNQEPRKWKFITPRIITRYCKGISLILTKKRRTKMGDYLRDSMKRHKINKSFGFKIILD